MTEQECEGWRLTFHEWTSLSRKALDFPLPWKAWPFISCGKCISSLIIQFQGRAEWRFRQNFEGVKRQCIRRWEAAELLSCAGLQGLVSAVSFYSSPPHLVLLCLSSSLSPMLWGALETPAGNGSSSQSNSTFKALFHACFPPNPEPGTCQLVTPKSSIRQKTLPPTPGPYGRRRGRLVSCLSRNQVTLFC